MSRIIERFNDLRADIAFLLWLYEARRSSAAPPSRGGAAVAEFGFGPVAGGR